MKQIFKTVAVLALGAFAASCAKEQIAAPSGGETEVTFTVSAPVIQTRAIADGNTVDKVACCVYNSQGELIEEGITQTVTMENGNATFTTRLVTGQTYSFLFWAYKSKGGDDADRDESAYYTLDKANKTVTVNYAGDSNDESRDAFYKYIASKTITGAVNETVELTRPFAQINFGVEIEDIVAAKVAGITVGKSKVKLTGLANKFDFVTGDATAEGEVTADFNLAALPAGNLPTEVSTTYDNGILEVNGKKYGYVAMNYVLPNGNANTELTVAEGDNTINTLAVNDVPLKANYRTNILGNLFTSAVQHNIVVEPAFETPDIVKVVEVDDIASANKVIKENSNADVIEVKFADVPSDAGDATVAENNANAILTTYLKEEATLNLEVAGSETTTLYVGDYTASSSINESGSESGLTVDTNANKATVNITIPEGARIGKLVINAPSKTVTINGVDAGSFSDTNVIGELEATTSAHTLIIEKGQTIGKLIFNQGGLEIHGTVNAVEVKGTTGNVFVRECENLSTTVYGVLKDYIAEDYVGVQGRTTAGLWDIVYAKPYANIPEGPEMSGSTVNVTAANAQFVLDGAYGSIDGKTINFTENISEILVFGRPTKFAASNTKYMVGGYTSDAKNYKEFETPEELAEYKSENSVVPRYLRTIKNVTFTANNGVTIEGIVASSGQFYASEEKNIGPVYDYVLDSGEWLTNGHGYYCAYKFENIKFEGISFNKNANFTKNGDGDSPSTIDGITFHKCKFLKYSTASSAGARVYFLNNSTELSYAFQNLTVDGCTFDTSFQGIYTQYVKNIKVNGSEFTTTGHNAIAIRDYGNTPDMGAVVITGNTFTGIGDRIIRFGNLGSDTQITITGNSSANSGDKQADGSVEVIKAETVSTGVTCNIEGNDNWTLKNAANLVYIIAQ